jgi:chorismate mutase/prephenate dehydratase
MPDDRSPADGAERADGDPRLAVERLRREIDAVDREIVGLLNRRASLGRQVGREKAALGWRASHDPEREREVLLRVSMANEGPLPQEDLLAIYRRLIEATRSLEDRDLTRTSGEPAESPEQR